MDEDKKYRALALVQPDSHPSENAHRQASPLTAELSAPGAGAGAGIAYPCGGGFKEVVHTVVNALAIVSGIVCDGAKASCAAKRLPRQWTRESGLQHVYTRSAVFRGDGIVTKGVEATLKNVGRLGKEGMKETNEEIHKNHDWRISMKK